MLNAKYLFLTLLFALCFSTINAEAGCNGSCAITDGDDWEVSTNTHMWDETIEIDNLNVNFGATLKLENVTIQINRHVTLLGETEWLKSNITLVRELITDNVTVHNELEIVSSKVNIFFDGNTTDAYGALHTEGIYLVSGSKLIVSDLDGNSSTKTDASIIKPIGRNENTYPSWYTWCQHLATWEIIGEESNTTVVNIKNSILIDIYQARIYGDYSSFVGNNVIGCRDIFFYGDNLEYYNNTHNAYELNDTRANIGGARAYDGENKIVSGNVFQGGGFGIDSERTKNLTIVNNEFYNLSSNAIWSGFDSSYLSIRNNTFVRVATTAWIGNVTNVTFSNNIIINSTNSYYSTYISGSDVFIYNNYFTKCNARCILFTNLGYSQNENIYVYNNNFSDFSSTALTIATGTHNHFNITVSDNLFHNGQTGIASSIWASYPKLPNNVLINDNIFTNLTTGIQFLSDSLSVKLVDADDYVIENNVFYDTFSGIGVYGSAIAYENLQILNNQIDVENYGINYICIKITQMASNFISSNSITAGQVGIALSNSMGSTEITDNNITTRNTGIDLFSSAAIIDNNNIRGVCDDEQCSKVSFTKVAEKGIRLAKNSEAEILNNFITNYYTSMEIQQSEADMVYENELNFSYYGIKSNEANIEIITNYINYTNSAIVIEGTEININNLIINSFETGIHAFNSSLNLESITLEDGNVCIEVIDSTYSIVSYDNMDCIEAKLYEKYFFNIKIQTNEGIEASQHNFEFKDFRETQEKVGYTGEDGYSPYYLIQVRKVDNSGLSTDFNPYYFTYVHNGISNTIEFEIRDNSTLFAYLDTTPPTTTVYSNLSLTNKNMIYLNFEKLSVKNDLLDYDLYALINDGINFAEWEYVGTYNQSMVGYEGVDGYKYRFKSISRDIYGNIEIKNGYDYEVRVDTSTPSSYFEGIGSDYYFTSNDRVLLNWESPDPDVSVFNVKIYYTNFTEDYLNPETVVWATISEMNYFANSETTFVMDKMGHYGFKVIAIDNAGNNELKEDYDFIINFDANSDKLAFNSIPEKWGDDYLEIEFDRANFNLDFRLFLALESVDQRNPYFNWYTHPHDANEEIIRLSGLLDRTRYYIYAESTDLAGNIENPLNSTEYFSGNGQYDQELKLTYIPLLKYQYEFNVYVDDNLDGTFETTLVRSETISGMGNTGYYLDTENKTILLGTRSGGFIPTEDLIGIKNIKVEYAGVHAIFEVYTGNPSKADNIAITPTNTTHIVMGYNIPNDAETCKVQSTTNISKGWFNQEIISPCESGYHEYEILNPQLDKQYYYRIMIEDQFGHISYSDNRSINMEDVVKLYSASSNTDSNQFGMREILPGAIGISLLFLLFGGVLMYRTREEDSVNETLIESKPVAKYKVEELYLIYKDGRLIKNLSAVEVKTDSEIMSGMLTAINDFVQDSFNTEGDLGDIGYGNNKIILQRGKNSYLAAVIYGETDNFFKSKMARAVRVVEQENPTIGSWNGDSETIKNVKPQLEPIIAETTGVTREMVDNYFNEKEIIVTTSYEIEGDNIKLKLNVSNYSADLISGCKIRPQYNDSVLRLGGIEPDVAYSFSENSFTLGDLNSYSEIQSVLKMKLIASGKTSVEIKMDYQQKGRDSTTSSTIDIE